MHYILYNNRNGVLAVLPFSHILCLYYRVTGAGSGGGADDPKFKRLVEMGFDPARVRSALAETKGDESAAVGKLLSQP